MLVTFMIISWQLGFATQSAITQLLDSKNHTLEQLLDEEDLIQECRQLNKKLIDFLACPEHIRALIDYVIVEPPEDGGDNLKYVYPYKASEVLTSDLNAIYDCIFANEDIVDKLFSFLDKPAPLNSLLAGYFCNILSNFLSRRPEETLKALEEKNVIPKFLDHMNTYSILDLLIKVVHEVESMTPSDYEWLYKINLVDRLIAMLKAENESEVHANVSVALVGVVSAPQTLHRLSSDLLEATSVNALLDHMLAGSESALKHGLIVLVELVRICDSTSRTAEEVDPVIDEVLNCLGELVEMLRNVGNLTPITNTAGLLDPPLGSNRLRILEVVQLLVRMQKPNINAKLVELDVLPACLDLLFRYEWHNFLHNLVNNMLETVLLGNSEEMKKSVIVNGKILDRIVDAHLQNDEWVKQPKRCRKGYMGQLRLISNLIVSQADSDEWMQEYIKQESWANFEKSHLNDLNNLNDRSQAKAVHKESTPIEDEYLSMPTSSTFEFRQQDSAELFSQDGLEDDAEDNVRLGVDQDMDLDTHEGTHDYTQEPQLDALSESVSAMHVDTEPEPQEQEKQMNEEKIDSPDFNDINFWKPKLTWFQGSGDM